MPADILSLMKKNVCRFARRILLLVIVIHLTMISVAAGSYIITKDNVTNTTETGLQVRYDTGASLVTTGTGFQTVSGAIYLRNFQLKPGQKWTTLSLTYISNATNLQFMFVDTAGRVIQVTPGTCAVSCTATYNISDYISESESNFTLRIQANNAPDEVQKLVVNYSGSSSIIAYPAPYEISQGNVTFAFDVPDNAEVTLTVYDSSGRVVKSIYDKTFVTAKNSPKAVATWNGRNDSGIMVSSGVYTVYVDVKFVATTTGTGDYNSSFRFAVFR